MIPESRIEEKERHVQYEHTGQIRGRYLVEVFGDWSPPVNLYRNGCKYCGLSSHVPGTWSMIISRDPVGMEVRDSAGNREVIS